MSTIDRPRPVKVLHSLAPPSGETKYADHMKGAAPPSVETLFFSWSFAFMGRYDVFHVHWPELLLRGGLWRLILTYALLLRLRLSRRPLVRTLHNIEPHEAASPTEARALRRVDDATSLFIRMNPTTPVHDDWVVADIPHSDYRAAFADLPTDDRIPGRFAYVGLIRPYKNVDGLLDAFAELDDPSLSLSISGQPAPAQREDIERRVERDGRVTARLAMVSDAEMVRSVTAAELVVLPYRKMHNSGVLLVALSLGRPALVPRTPSNQAMADEVGEGWVLQYDGDISPEVLAWGLAQARRVPELEPPRLEGRSWPTVGALHERAYREAIRLARSPRGRSARVAAGARE